MNPAPSAAERARDPDPELRYRAVLELDPGAELALIVERLADESWRVRKAAIERLAAAPRPQAAIEHLLRMLADGENAGARNAAAEALARIGRPARPALVKSLQAEDADVRKFAADVLGEIGDRAAAAALIGALSDQDENVRVAAAEALGKVGGRDAAGALEGVLDKGERLLALAALESLSRLGHTPPLAVLAPLARDRYLRRPVLRLLGTLSGRAALELIAEGLKDPSRSTREAAFEAASAQLRRLGEKGAQTARQVFKATLRSTGRVADRARELLAARNVAALDGAIRVLGLFGEAKDAPAVVKAGVDEAVQEAALGAVEKMGPPAGSTLLKSLPDLLPEARLLAVRALSRLRERAAAPAILQLAREGGEAERRVAVEALAALGDPASIPAVARLLEDPELAADAARALSSLAKVDPAAVREACSARLKGEGAPSALRVLGTMGGPEALPLIRSALQQERAEVRVAAVEAASACGEPVEPLLRVALADESPGVRAAAAKGLCGCAPDEQTTAALLAALDDRDPSVAAAAAEALGAAGEARAVGPLSAALSRGDLAPGTPEVLPAIAAVRALARMRQASASLLARAAAHGDPEVVKEAVDAASAITDGEAVLLEALHHARWDVRRAAARAVAARGDRALLEPLRALAAAEKDPLVCEALAESIGALEARPVRRGPD